MSQVQNSEIYMIVNMLAARAFHDMAGPASALQNGVSFLEDPDVFDVARKHLEDSATSLNHRLEFFRLLLGRRSVDQIGWEVVRRQVMAYVMDDRAITVHWAKDLVPEKAKGSADLVRCILCLFLVMKDVLCKGGTLHVSAFDETIFRVIAGGGFVDQKAESLCHMQGGVSQLEALSPRTAPGSWLRHCAAAQNLGIEVDVQLPSSTAVQHNESLAVALWR